MPGLYVEGVGNISVPLTQPEAERLAGVGTQAPHGKGFSLSFFLLSLSLPSFSTASLFSLSISLSLPVFLPFLTMKRKNEGEKRHCKEREE